MNKNINFYSFQYNENFKKWLWFVNETLVGAFVGALIAFVFGSHYWAALTAFGILMLFLVILSVFFVFLESKVSVLSIMNQGLKDGKYEDVIKFGSAMRTTLFTANKNDEIVTLGNKIDEAATKIESEHYNRSKGDYQVTIDGKQKSITEIRIGLKIDDLGWSMHLIKKNDDALSNIIDGIRKSRNEALRLSRIKENKDGKSITPFVNLILRGYRHLSGIYYENAKEHWRAEFYENVTRLIMSNNKIVSVGGVCEGRISKDSNTVCGLLCGFSYEEKVNCAKRNIIDLYYDDSYNTNETNEFDDQSIHQYLNISHGALMSIEEIEDDIKLFNMLPKEIKGEIIKEQCYSWGRNIVKKIQNCMYKHGEYDFISDYELSCKVAEARAFSQVYYYGPISIEKINDDFHDVVNKEILGKSELRYLSLMSEIELLDLFQPISRSAKKNSIDGSVGRNMKIEKLIDNLKSIREIFRDKRADLYVRTSINLITAIHLEFNINNRYIVNDVLGKSLDSKEKKIKRIKSNIKSLYNEIKNYEHQSFRLLGPKKFVLLSFYVCQYLCQKKLCAETTRLVRP
jgi:hypothetical protein